MPVSFLDSSAARPTPLKLNITANATTGAAHFNARNMI
jgi:hypothetical protein